jgi:hypothetical protein
VQKPLQLYSQTNPQPSGVGVQPPPQQTDFSQKSLSVEQLQYSAPFSVIPSRLAKERTALATRESETLFPRET